MAEQRRIGFRWNLRAIMAQRNLWKTTELMPLLKARGIHSNWVFRGYSPGRHIDASHLRNRLRQVFSTRAARLGTLHELTKLAPIAILAEALGYHPATIERHAVDSAAAYSRYVAAVRGG